MSFTPVSWSFPFGASTGTSLIWFVVAPLPNLPDVPTPHAQTLPSSFKATEKLIPELTLLSVYP